MPICDEARDAATADEQLALAQHLRIRRVDRAAAQSNAVYI